MKKSKNSKDYLKNSICNFTPLFDIDYTKKKNIYSASFFKIKKGGYKDFSKYVDGLDSLYHHIEKKHPDYSLRLFIDDSIYKDKKIMNRIKKLKNIELVHYNCPNFIIDNIYHRGVFGTFIRFFPMFNFKNNDANIVITIDIDFDEKYPIPQLYKIRSSINIKFIDNIYYICRGNLLRGKKHKLIKYNKIIPYIYASYFISLKRFKKNIIIDFLLNIENYSSKNLKSIYDSDIKNTGNNKFVFGSDEYFLNYILIENSLINNLSYSVYYTYNINGPFYTTNLKWDSLTKDEKMKSNNVIDFILNNKNSSLSYHDKFKKLDKIIYTNKKNNITKKKIEILNRLNKLYEMLYEKKIFFGYFKEDFLSLAIKNYKDNIISKETIVTYINNKSYENILKIERLKK